MKLNSFFTCLTSFFAILTLSHHLQCMERGMEAGGLFHHWWFWRMGRMGQSGLRAQFFYSSNIATASTEQGREPQHWQKEGGAAFLWWWETSEWRCGGWYGVGFGQHSGLDICWMLFCVCLVKGNSPHEVSWCLFQIFCDPQPEIPNFWNTAAFSNVAPV